MSSDLAYIYPTFFKSCRYNQSLLLVLLKATQCVPLPSTPITSVENTGFHLYYVTLTCNIENMTTAGIWIWITIFFNYFAFRHLFHALLVSSSLLFPEKSILWTTLSFLSFLVSKYLFGIQILIPRRRSWSICWPIVSSVLKIYFLDCCTLPII